MSSIVTTLANSVECACCAANRISILRLRKLNTICIGCLSMLAIGSATFSAYFMYKIWKYQKKLAYLEKKFDSLKLNITDDDTTSEDQNELESDENLDDEEIFDEDSDSSSTASEFVNKMPINKNSTNQLHDSNKTEPIQIKSRNLNNRSNLVKSPVSCDEIEVNYETPLGSPDKSYGYLNNNHFMNEDKTNKVDDNKCLDLIISESYESVKKISSNYQKIYEDDPNNVEKCVDYIRSLYILADKETNAEEKKQLQLKAYELAKLCIQNNENSYLAQKWFSITTGRYIDHMSINDKVKYGFEFKEHLDIAISLNDTDYMLFYLRGRWSFKMCNLSWPEKCGVRLVFGKVPDVNLEDALRDFLKAEELHKNKSKGNLLHLAKCFINKNEIKKAVGYLNQALSLPTRTAEHHLDNEEINGLLKKYSTKSF